MIRLAVLLRLAITAWRVRTTYGSVTVQVAAHGETLHVHIAGRSRAQRDAAEAELAEECAQMAKSGIRIIQD